MSTAMPIVIVSATQLPTDLTTQKRLGGGCGKPDGTAACEDSCGNERIADERAHQGQATQRATHPDHTVKLFFKRE